MKYIDAERLKDDLYKRIGKYDSMLHERSMLVVKGKREEAFELLTLVESLQQEQPEVDLDELINDFLLNNSEFLVERDSKVVVQKLARYFYEIGRLNAKKRNNMAKYIDAEKIRSEVERIKETGCESPISVCNDILSFIDSFLQEQPSPPSNLEDAAEEFEKHAMEDYDEICVNEDGSESPVLNCDLKDAFKAGAEWMAGQRNVDSMKEALRLEYERGKADALKDLPKWRKFAPVINDTLSEQRICNELENSVLRVDVGGYCWIISREELNKLPKEDEE